MPLVSKCRNLVGRTIGSVKVLRVSKTEGDAHKWRFDCLCSCNSKCDFGGGTLLAGLERGTLACTTCTRKRQGELAQRRYNGNEPEPTPEEILARCAIEQSHWNKKTELARRSIKNPAWEVPGFTRQCGSKQMATCAAEETN